jgi:chaperone required for assembly of F1-ATPase
VKRFWATASIEPEEAGFCIRLDQRPLRLPGGAVLRVKPAALAAAIAEEWDSAGAEMSFADTPLTRLAGTAQERIAPDPWPTVGAIARYGESDLLCYRAESPEALVRRQAEGWQPWLDWAAASFGAELRVTTGIRPVKQHRGAVAALRQVVGASDPYRLAGLGLAVPALGSLVLALALAEGRLSADSAHELGALDELFQAGLWGGDPEAAARRAAIRKDIAVAARFMELAGAEGRG